MCSTPSSIWHSFLLPCFPPLAVMGRGDAALVAAAVRHVAAQTQLDLSGAAFKRFIEVHYTVSHRCIVVLFNSNSAWAI